MPAGIEQVLNVAPFFSVIANHDPPVDCAPTQKPTVEEDAASAVPVVHGEVGTPAGGSLSTTPVEAPQVLSVIEDSTSERLVSVAPR